MTFVSDKIISFQDLTLERFVISEDNGTGKIEYRIHSSKLDIDITTESADEALLKYSNYQHQLKSLKQKTWKSQQK